MREFTQQEQQAILQAELQLREQGLIVDDADGQQKVDHNVERILAYFDLNKTTPLTVQTVLTAVQQMKDQLKWKSAAQMEYEKVYNALSAAEQNAFGAWWFRQKNVLILEGDEGFSNAAQIIAWMRGRAFDARGLDVAVSNLAGSSRRPLHWAPTREQVSSGRPGHAPSGAFAPKSETNLSARDHQKRTAAAADAAAGRKTPTPGTDYRKLCEEIKGSTHSKTAQIQRLFVMIPGTSEIDYEQTYFSRRRAAGL
jgi:hypothetical protein